MGDRVEEMKKNIIADERTCIRIFGGIKALA